MTKRHKAGKKTRAAILIILVAALAFVLGNLCVSWGLVDLGHQLGFKNPRTQSAASPDDQVTTRQLAARLDEVATYLDGYSLYRYTQEDLDTATTEAINQLLKTSADPYAQYFTPEQYAAYQKSSEGEYMGIGVILSMIDDKITVVQAYDNGPASEGGVLPGDVLVAIDGDHHSWKLEEAIRAINRPAGQQVEIIWQRNGTDRTTQLTVESVNIPTVTTHLIAYQGQLVGYVSLRRFSLQSGSELSAAITQLEQEGASALILDLRNNPGGYITQAIQVTSLFVPQGAVVNIEDLNGIKTRGVTGNTITNLPLAVLINADSASASELVAAALQDHGRATIVGDKSFGKGTVQDLNELSWGGAIKYTIAHYLSPNGNTIDGIGVTPDVQVAFTSTTDQPAVADMLSSSAYLYTKGVDAQLDAALVALAALDPQPSAG